jgi:hypothetical protein
MSVTAMFLMGACGGSSVAMDCAPYATPEELAERSSPFDSVEVVIDSSHAKVCYSRPFARGRVVFGDLVPWDTLWRTGANEPTIIHLNVPAEIAGMPVTPGHYSIYTVPSQAGWAVVVNASTSQWGQTRSVQGPDGTFGENSYTPEVQAQEIGRAPVSTDDIEYTEQLTARFGPVSGDRVDLQIDWESTRVAIPILFRPSH